MPGWSSWLLRCFLLFVCAVRATYGKFSNWELTASLPSVTVESVSGLLLEPSVYILLMCYYCRRRGHNVPARRQLRSSYSMKRPRVDCGHLRVLGNWGHANKQQDIVSRWNPTCLRAVPSLLFCFSHCCLTCLSESGVPLVCDIRLLIAAVQRKTSGCESQALFLYMFTSKPFLNIFIIIIICMQFHF